MEWLCGFFLDDEFVPFVVLLLLRLLLLLVALVAVDDDCGGGWSPAEAMRLLDMFRLCRISSFSGSSSFLVMLLVGWYYCTCIVLGL